MYDIRLHYLPYVNVDILKTPLPNIKKKNISKNISLEIGFANIHTI